LNKKEEKNAPIDVNGSITPITKQEVPLVLPDQWSSMSISELYQQLNILQDRLTAAYELKQFRLIPQIQQGIDKINIFIKNKPHDKSASFV